MNFYYFEGMDISALELQSFASTAKALLHSTGTAALDVIRAPVPRTQARHVSLDTANVPHPAATAPSVVPQALPQATVPQATVPIQPHPAVAAHPLLPGQQLNPGVLQAAAAAHPSLSQATVPIQPHPATASQSNYLRAQGPSALNPLNSNVPTTLNQHATGNAVTKQSMDNHSLFVSSNYMPLRISPKNAYVAALYVVGGIFFIFFLVIIFKFAYDKIKKKKK